MCRLLAYLGAPLHLENLLYKPDHSLVVQSYQPKEMTAGLLNADGFGIGWYHAQQTTEPFTYKNVLPIWNDINLPNLARYVESPCILANIRSATPGLPVDLSNCQPFQYDSILGIHNGYIENFRFSLRRPIQDRLEDNAHCSLKGTTDSEHILALLMHEWWANPELTMAEALHKTLRILSDLADKAQVAMSANIVVSDGTQMVASRYAQGCPTPSLYWLQGDRTLPDSLLIASEPLFESHWHCLPERSILTVGPDLKPEIEQF